MHTLYNGRAELRARLGAAWYGEPAHVRGDTVTRPHARALGRSRAFLRAELVDDATWRREPSVNELLRPLGVRDRLMGGAPAGPRFDVAVGLDRLDRSRPFGERERDLLGAFVDRQGWALRGLAAAPAVAGPLPWGLTPREAEALELLLTGLTEPAAAEEMGVSAHTFHDYAKAIHAKLGVPTRAELLARAARGTLPLSDEADPPGERPMLFTPLARAASSPPGREQRKGA
jgi:DNA-binding CsgD family transcriptional regulator